MTDFDKDSIYRAWDEPLDQSEQAALDDACAADPALRREADAAKQLRVDLRALRSVPEMERPPLDWSRLESADSGHRRPVAVAAAAALLIGAAVALWSVAGSWGDTEVGMPGPLAIHVPPDSEPTAAPDPEPAPAVDAGHIEVAFALIAPDAAKVAVAGDFNDWTPTAMPMSASDRGRWQARAALPPGRYAYMYVVDGQWITPPDAQRTQDDGFGARNGILDLLPPPGV